jgi:hypothetical protein
MAQIAPGNSFPERVTNTYERKMAPDKSGQRGPLRFEEGLATDTDLPNEFVNGIMQGYITDGPNRNKNVYEKYPEETMRERAHVGSASWVEAPTYLSEFANGTQVPGKYEYLMVNRGAPNPSGRRYERRNPAEVTD